ncbi:hypothetical protein VNO77_27694 [Canavalia gladiata]|uniref:Uncharacterized protein n=1 Tax=Canavalia gladiata TaxID=3824 RepID=A0AAN9Q7A5_CANGL
MSATDDQLAAGYWLRWGFPPPLSEICLTAGFGGLLAHEWLEGSNGSAACRLGCGLDVLKLLGPCLEPIFTCYICKLGSFWLDFMVAGIEVGMATFIHVQRHLKGHYPNGCYNRTRNMIMQRQNNHALLAFDLFLAAPTISVCVVVSGNPLELPCGRTP